MRSHPKRNQQQQRRRHKQVITKRNKDLQHVNKTKENNSDCAKKCSKRRKRTQSSFQQHVPSGSDDINNNIIEQLRRQRLKANSKKDVEKKNASVSRKEIKGYRFDPIKNTYFPLQGSSKSTNERMPLLPKQKGTKGKVKIDKTKKSYNVASMVMMMSHALLS